MKTRFLTPGEKRDVVAAALDVLRPQHPGRHVHIDVEDWTDSRGVPQWKAAIGPVTGGPPAEEQK